MALAALADLGSVGGIQTAAPHGGGRALARRRTAQCVGRAGHRGGEKAGRDAAVAVLADEPVPDVAPDKPDVQCTSEVPCEHGVGPCAHDNQCWGGRCYGRHKARNLLKGRLPHEWPDDWGVCWRDQEAPSSDENSKNPPRRTTKMSTGGHTSGFSRLEPNSILLE